jgi:hypothetical protein
MKKIIQWFFISLLALIIAAFAIVYFYLNTIVASQIEKFGSQALKAKVVVGSANVSLFPIGLKIKKLSIDKDDKNDPMKRIYAEKIEISVDHNSLKTSVPVINYITVNSPEVTYDIGILGAADAAVKAIKDGDTVGAIQSGLSAFADGIKSLYKDKEEEPKKKKSENTSGSTQKFVIKKIYINSAKFIPASNKPILDKIKEIPLPDMEMQYSSETTGDAILKDVLLSVEKAAVKKLVPTGN